MTVAPTRPEGRRPRPLPKGRPLDTEALADIRRLLAERPRRRDLLIEHLHLVQDAYGHLSARHLRALAEEMRLSMAEVWEVASFYAHFDLVKDGEDAPAPVTVRVCTSVSCMLAGGAELAEALAGRVDPARVRVVPAPCIGRCAEAPAALAGRRAVDHATPEAIEAVLGAGDLDAVVPDHVDLAAYRAGGGHRLLAAVRSGEHSIESVIAALSDAGLRGLGGAGFPAGRKWSIVRAQPAPRLMTVNADEGEPGTFKDRLRLESDPHRFLEGMLIAAHAVDAAKIVIYLRDEYPAVRAILARCLAELAEAGLVAPDYVDLRRGAGAYVCGEESAMLESIEGKRGLPRNRPPYIAERGLFGRPTLNHNVETLFWIRSIIEDGPAAFAGQGVNGSKGLRSWSVSGRVAKPGLHVAPAGVTAADLLRLSGGMAEGHAFRAFLPGGASGGILPAAFADRPLDFGTLDDLGSFVGSHAVVFLSDKDDLRAVAANLMRFFEHESCGQCTPCRVGTGKAAVLLEGVPDDDVLRDLAQVMADASICGLGQAAANPIRSLLRFFPEAMR